MSIANTKGVDISYAQGDINLSKIKVAGYGWVMIRCGQGGSNRITDNQFSTNVRKAESLGMPWGAYLFTEACSTAMIKDEIAKIDKLLKAEKAKGYKPTLPIALDVEYESHIVNGGGWNEDNISNITAIYAEEMRELGYYPMIYANYSTLKNWVDSNTVENCDIWLAQYNIQPDWKKNLCMWQFSDGDYDKVEYKPLIDGFSDPIDKDIVYKDYPSIIKNGGYNGWSKSSGSSSATTTTPTTTTTPITATGNPAIKKVQTWLNTNYNTGLAVDGFYGDKTKAALVKTLQTELNKQTKAGLVVDGVYGNKTNAAVFNLSVGSRGNITKILQGLLICNGLSTNGFDGVYGNGTKIAVKTYQSNNGLTADGVAGKQTFSKLCK